MGTIPGRGGGVVGVTGSSAKDRVVARMATMRGAMVFHGRKVDAVEDGSFGIRDQLGWGKDRDDRWKLSLRRNKGYGLKREVFCGGNF